ncbi:hypothetical protein CMUS01_16117 [Colletotrichum musicola]|uniref:CBM21 domain-containing protein n=1 Tax=Colletotrichum musicola TaxID=2175873 RepID=A0A8H6MKC5_9PEZI|nr:hypothetical protein CMUS01_16117 [Colletotrichum musicola]
MAVSAECHRGVELVGKRSGHNSPPRLRMPLVEIFPPKPPLLRKLSGQLVRPVLRPLSRRRPATAPATPGAKVVHFDDSRMEQVRRFRANDSPESLSPTHPDPNDNDCDDNESRNTTTCCCYELDPTLSDLPRSSPARLRQMVRLDAVFLSDDGRFLAGLVEVANLAYEKAVVCRFSFDGWETVSEVTAEYSAPVYPGSGRPGSYDGFVFSIDLGGLVSVESRTMELCVRYVVDGNEFWDNNDYVNFRIRLERRRPEARGQDMGDVPFECQLTGRSGCRMSPWSSLGLEPIEHCHADVSSTTSNGTCRSFRSAYVLIPRALSKRYDLSGCLAAAIPDAGKATTEVTALAS